MRKVSRLFCIVLTLAMFMMSLNVMAAQNTSDPQMPNAEVSVLDPLTLTKAKHDYMCWPSGDITLDRPLQIVMNFKANDTLEEAKASGLGKYICDFYLTFEGLKDGFIVANECYLAGNYGPFGWIVIPADGLELHNGVEYPVVSAYDANITYEQICDSVKDFTAAIHVSDKILEDNPGFKVTLALKMKNPVTEEMFTVGTPAVYTHEDLEKGNIYIANYNSAKDAISESTQSGGTIEATQNTAAVENAKEELKKLNSNLTEDQINSAELSLNVSLDDMKIADSGIPSRYSYDVTPVLAVKDTDDKVPVSQLDTEVTFKLPVLKMEISTKAIVYHNNDPIGIYGINKDSDGNKYVEVSAKDFSTYSIEPGDGFCASVNETGYVTLEDAIANATNGDKITVLDNITVENTIEFPAGLTVTLDLKGCTISQTKNQTSNYSMIQNDGTLTIMDSASGGKISYTDSGTNTGYVNYASNTITNRGTLILKSGTVENLSSETVATYGYPYAIDTSIWGAANEVNTVIEGGKVCCNSYSAMRLRGDSTTKAVNITVLDGEIVGTIEVQNSSSVAAKGKLTISGGKLSNSGTPNVLYIFGNNQDTALQLEITAGEFTGNVTKKDSIGDSFNDNFIFGGTFGTDVSNYCAAGFGVSKDDSGSYSIIPVDAVVSYSLALEGQIGYRVTYKLTEDTYNNPDAKIVFSFERDGETVTFDIPVKEGTEVGDNKYQYIVELYSYEMTTDITSKLVVGQTEQIGCTATASVRDYAEYVIDAPIDDVYTADLKVLMKAMLNYGAYAQQYFEYNAEDLANDEYEVDLESADYTNLNSINSVEGSLEGIEISTISLELESRTTIRYTFVLGENYSIGDYTFECNGNQLNAEKLDNQTYRVKIENINVYELDESYTVAVKRTGSDGSYNVTSSALSYADIVVKGEYTNALKDVCKALYLYNQAGNTYFGK